MQRGGTPRPSFRHRLGSAVAAIAVLLCALAPPADAQGEPKPASFVRAQGTRFVLGDQPFNVAGVNNHYLTFGSEQEVLRVLDDAVAIGANVVRTFLQPLLGCAPQVLRGIKAQAIASREAGGWATHREVERGQFLHTWLHDDHWAVADRVLDKGG